MIDQVKEIATREEARELGAHICSMILDGAKFSVLEAVNNKTKETTYRVLVEFGRLRCIAYSHNRFKAAYTDSRNHVTEVDAKTAAGALKALRVELLTISTVYQHGAGMIK
ncbi:hypothetical protein RJ142_CDS0055 [Klebsiella phage EKq1]|nr:hypothetical protein S8c_00031 [Klebsiella phage VLCpiS8c]WNV46724.1 hypothetical protein RJ142_CDS0055 [Klebsiella phage EKq1]